MCVKLPSRFTGSLFGWKEIEGGERKQSEKKERKETMKGGEVER